MKEDIKKLEKRPVPRHRLAPSVDAKINREIKRLEDLGDGWYQDSRERELAACHTRYVRYKETGEIRSR